eukprot:366061-Chlamydomonas_euryale.AAC.14
MLRSVKLGRTIPVRDAPVTCTAHLCVPAESIWHGHLLWHPSGTRASAPGRQDTAAGVRSSARKIHDVWLRPWDSGRWLWPWGTGRRRRPTVMCTRLAANARSRNASTLALSSSSTAPAAAPPSLLPSMLPWRAAARSTAARTADTSHEGSMPGVALCSAAASPLSGSEAPNLFAFDAAVALQLLQPPCHAC